MVQLSLCRGGLSLIEYNLIGQVYDTNVLDRVSAYHDVMPA